MSPADRSWIDPLVHGLARPAYEFTMARIQDSGVSEEIVQEAFVRAWQSPKTPRELPEFERWLYTIILNLVRDHERRSARWFRIPFFQVPLAQLTNAHDSLGDPDVADGLRHLTRRERDAVYLRFFEDLSYRDAAAILHVRESTVRVLVNRALRKLRQRLAPTGAGLPEGSE